uniref:PHD-type domain-containing protein n=1 Tax=Anas platyrhynchos TaxID=8839 RepID=A0A8B9TMG8_ANAPL
MPPSPLAVCRLCQRADDNPEVFGETCQQDGLCIHENCLVSRQGVQPPGFFGFLFPDIHQELQRVAQKTCCICWQQGASVTCQVRRCPRNFHFPCGIEQGCISQFFGEFKTCRPSRRRCFAWASKSPTGQHPSPCLCLAPQ